MKNDLFKQARARRAAIEAGREYFEAIDRHRPIPKQTPEQNKAQKHVGLLSMATAFKSFPGGRDEFLLAFAEGRKCILCGGKTDRVGLFVPPFPGMLDEPDGKHRSMWYPFCKKCADLGVEALTAVEAKIYHSANKVTSPVQ